VFGGWIHVSAELPLLLLLTILSYSVPVISRRAAQAAKKKKSAVCYLRTVSPTRQSTVLKFHNPISEMKQT
jgi:hypothetical protein